MGTLIEIDGPNGPAGGDDSFTCRTNLAGNTTALVTGDVTCGSYDAFGRITRVVKPNDSAANPTLQMWYYDGELPVRYRVDQREPLSGPYVSQLFYDGLGRQIQSKVRSDTSSQQRNTVTDTRYDGLGRVTQLSQPRFVNETVSTFVTYSPVPGSGMRWTTTTYDALSRISTQTTPDPDNSVTTHRYGIHGNGLRWHDVTDARRHRTQFQHDSLGRLTTALELRGNCGNYWGYTCSTAPFTATWTTDATTTYSYSALDQLTQATDANGNLTTLSYDSAGRKTAMSDPDMGTWRYDYDANGNLRAQTSASLGAVLFQYDPLGRLTTRLGQDSSNTTFSDTFNTKNTTNWSWSTHQTVPFNDGGNNVVQNTGTGSGFASFNRAAHSLTHGEGLSLRFKVNNTSPNAYWRLESNGTTAQKIQLLAQSSLLRVQHAADGTNYVTNPQSMALSANVWYRLFMTVDDVSGLSVHVFRESDPSQRLSVQVPLTAGQGWRFHQAINSTNTAFTDAYAEYGGAVYGYDATSSTNFGRGRRTSMEVLGGARTTWGYDTRGRVISATHTLPALGAAQRNFQWQYNSADAVTQVTFPAVNGSAESITYAYTAAGQPSSVCISGGGCYAQSGQYNALGQPTFRRHGNNAVQRWLYDSPLSRLDQIQVGTDSVPGSLFDRSYDYDRVGNVTLIADNTSPGIPDQSYSYDHRDRLVRWQLGSTAETYAYDLIGNLTSKAGVTQQYGANFNGTGAGPHQLRRLNGSGGPTFSYDLNGNMLSGGGRTYTWTAENMPASITSGGVTETYTYNADNARVTRTRGSTTTIYLEGIWEEVVGGTTTKYYTLNGAEVALRTHSGSTSSVSYLHGDHLGSAGLSTGATGSPATPVLQSQQEFDPWGAVRAGSMAQTRRNFTGQYLDETGLLFYNARYYDPAVGRFVSADTIVPGSNILTVWPGDPVAAALWGWGGSGPLNPQDLNRYTYVLNNPVRYTDPTGHLAPLAIGGMILLGGVVNLAVYALTTDQAEWTLQDAGAEFLGGMLATGIGMALGPVAGAGVKTFTASKFVASLTPQAAKYATTTASVVLNGAAGAVGDVIGSGTTAFLNTQNAEEEPPLAVKSTVAGMVDGGVSALDAGPGKAPVPALPAWVNPTNPPERFTNAITGPQSWNSTTDWVVFGIGQFFGGFADMAITWWHNSQSPSNSGGSSGGGGRGYGGGSGYR